MKPKPIHVAIGAGILILLAAFAPAFYFYTKYSETKKLLSRNPLILENEDKQLIEKIGKLIDLPVGENPTLATVTDVEKIKNQPFFSKAKNGDKVLIYNNAKKAILYDPTANKIIEVGPLIVPNVSPESQAATPSAQPVVTTPPPDEKKTRVFLYNGTKIAGITLTVEKLLSAKIPTAAVVDRDVAQKKDYAKTMVIAISGNHKEETEEIAKVLEAEVSTLPAGETKPADGDILIIVGEDKK